MMNDFVELMKTMKAHPFICSMLLALGERAAFAATLNPYVSENSRTLCHQNIAPLTT